MSESGIKISTVRCPSCGTSLNLGAPKVESIACSSCGTLFDPEKLKVLTKGAFSPEEHPPRSFIRLGVTGKFNDRQYQVIGRIRYFADLAEWDAEDGQYYTEGWTWDEWILVGEKKDYLYIHEDQEGYSISESFIPTNPESPEAEMMNLDGGTPQRVMEKGSAKSVYQEGEFTWTPYYGEEVRFAEYIVGGITYSAEGRVGKKNELVEVEFFKSHPITEIELLRAFDFKEEIKQYEAREAVRRQNKRWSNAFFTAALLLLFLSICTTVAGGREIFRQNVSIDLLNSNEGIVAGPFNLSKPGKIYNLKLSASIPDNSDAWAAVELLEDEDTTVNEFEGDFWRESGYDDEGAWSESDTVKENYFRLEQPGEYYARILGEPGPKLGAGNVTLSVYEGATLSRYFILASLLALAFGVGIRAKNSLNPFWIVGGFFVLLFAIFAFMKKHSDDDDD